MLQLDRMLNAVNTNHVRKKQPGLIDKRTKEFERRCLLRILRKTRGNIRQAALFTDTRRSRLYKMMREHGIKIADIRNANPR